MHSGGAKDGAIQIVCVGERELRCLLPSNFQNVYFMVQVDGFSLARILSIGEEQ